jgi:hypothetical protein
MIVARSRPSSSLHRVRLAASSFRKPSPKIMVSAPMISSQPPIESPCDTRCPRVTLCSLTARRVSATDFAGNFAINDKARAAYGWPWSTAVAATSRMEFSMMVARRIGMKSISAAAAPPTLSQWRRRSPTACSPRTGLRLRERASMISAGVRGTPFDFCLPIRV